MKVGLALIFTTALACGISACGPSRKSVAPVETGMPVEDRIISGPVRAIPQARIYRMSGACAELVPINLDAKGDILSYPAPSDLNDSQKPLPLADSWYLDRRGVGPSTVLTTYTYAQYGALSAPPSPAELRSHISPDCRVTQVVALPMSQTEAASDTAAVNRLIRSGLPGCRTLK